MLSDREVEEAVTQLANFRSANDSHHATQSEIFEKYDNLLHEVKRLRSDLEEERETREKYKQMARGQERNPFVLVLVDGDGYVFDDDLIRNGVEGGERAAQLLNDVVKRSLRSRGLEHCRIMVRVYANLVGLSKAVSRVKLAGPEKRSLAPFTASFTRSNELFDFVDAGELKENADFKIRGLFRQFAENTQCRHIFFAGCHDVGYISELTQYAGDRNRFTLVRGPGFHHQFNKLNLHVEDFADVFRSMPLDVAVPSTPAKSKPTTTASISDAAPSGQQICSFYQKGMCKYGSNCKFAHIKFAANGTSNGGSLSDVHNWRQNASSDNSSVPFGMPSLAKNDNDFMSGHQDPVQTQIDFATMLPEAGIAAGQIPVNKAGYRLDAYLQLPTPEHKSAFQARVAVKKLCNSYHINGICPNGETCPYDHRHASPAMLNCLKQVATQTPCPRRGACRSLTCIHGHICQVSTCKFRGGSTYCKQPLQVHNQDLNFARFELCTMPKVKEEYEADVSVSWKGFSSPALAEMKSPRSMSDGETEEGEGALLDDLNDDAAVD